MENDHSWKELAGRLKDLLEEKEYAPEDLKQLMSRCDEANMALALEELDTEKAIIAFGAVPESCASKVLSMIAPDRAKKILKHLDVSQFERLIDDMQPKDAAALVADAPSSQQRELLKNADIKPVVREEAETRLEYHSHAAGRLMTSQFVRIPEGQTVRDAIAAIRQTNLNEKIPEDIFIVATDTIPCEVHGVISIRQLLMHEDDQLVDDLMETNIICIEANQSQMDAAALLSKYRFQTLPVVNKENRLVGVIPVDDLLQVMIGRLRKLYTKAVGTDAQKMAGLSAFGEAKLRIPWLLGTMAIELVAGLVIHKYDAILQKVILLASFMPVISAISGNVGLQAAAITVRAVDTRLPGGHDLGKAVRKELLTSFFMAVACAFILGIIGAFWAKHIPFGLVIGGALLCSMITAGTMGTIIPIFSKRLGFDPATTAGPFETALQDIVGFGVFLWLATMFQDWIT